MQAGDPEKSFMPRWLIFGLAGLVLALLGYIASGIYIETNILYTLPRTNPVMADGHQVIVNHPYQNRVLIDLASSRKNPDSLAEAAKTIEDHLEQSGLFKSVGINDAGRIFSSLMTHSVRYLPVLLTAEDLEKKVAPMLEKDELEKRVRENLSGLFTMDASGQSRAMIKDPLGLRHIVLEKTKGLMPAGKIRFYKGRLFSEDLRHVLITASPAESATGSEAARSIELAIKNAEKSLRKKHSSGNNNFTITAMGAYRAVIDNETAAKSDASRAVFFSGLGIAALLMLAFPRPLMGLLAFVPAIFGTLAALAFYSLYKGSISIMALGFGGAIIAITVDHGISYLLFADRPHETRGKDASKEVWAVAFVAALTSSGAFFMLVFSGFPILAEIGQFAALGIVFSFFFVHTGFPLLFPKLKPAKRKKPLVLQKAVDRIVLYAKKTKLIIAITAAVILAFFAKPEFCADISSINTVTKATLDAEQQIASTWGTDALTRVHVMAQADNISQLMDISQRLSEKTQVLTAGNKISAAFFPSMLFPGQNQCRANLSAWNSFWQKKGQGEIAGRIGRAARSLGMDPHIFSDVYLSRDIKCIGGIDIDPDLYEFLGIHKVKDSRSWMLFSSLTPAEHYDAGNFFKTFSSEEPDVFVFDPQYYSQSLGRLLSETFLKMLAVVGTGVVVLVLIFFADLTLTAVSLLPLCFSLVCTLGVLHLLGQPLNIPGLMLSVVVLGMGLDYCLYFVRAYQRYGNAKHRFFDHIRMTVFLAAASTLIGFAALAAGEHQLMKSLGRIMVPAVGFVLMGTFFLLPAICEKIFRPADLPPLSVGSGSKEHKRRLKKLYRHLEAYPRFFALIKIKTDPMFAELPEILKKPKTIFDIGCGYGVTAAWLMAMDPKIRIYGMDPDGGRIRFAKRLTGKNENFFRKQAPDLPDLPESADTVLMLDMIHYISDHGLGQTLAGAYALMQPGGLLIMRAAVPLKNGMSFLRRVEMARIKLKKMHRYDRTSGEIRQMITSCGFEMTGIKNSGQGREEKWFLASKPC
jgi:predicted exporter/ubiquinone/menaquinone biosynthesis C-methylase UbiE